MHGEARLSELWHQRVAVLEDVCDLVVETLTIAVAHHGDDEALGTTMAHALDQHQDPGPSGRGRLVSSITSVHRPSGAPRWTLRHVGRTAVNGSELWLTMA